MKRVAAGDGLELPPGVYAAFTTRLGGVSTAPWDSFNVATHVGDDPAHVAANRARLPELLELAGPRSGSTRFMVP